MFKGTVRLARDPMSLPAVLLVAGDRLKVSAHDHEIGDWRLSELTASVREDGCHVSVEGEELVIAVPEPRRFAEAIGPSVSNPGNGSLLEFGRQAGTTRGQMLRRAGGLSRRTYLIGSGLTATVFLLMWAPAILTALVLLGSLTSLLVGGIALMDPFTAVRIPDAVTPGLLIRAGGAGVLLSLGLALLI